MLHFQQSRTNIFITAAEGYQDMVFRHALMLILQSSPKLGHFPLVHIATSTEPIWFGMMVAPDALANRCHTKLSHHGRTEIFCIWFLEEVKFYKDILLVDFVFLASLLDLCHDLYVVFIDEGCDDVKLWFIRLLEGVAHFLVLLPVSL